MEEKINLLDPKEIEKLENRTNIKNNNSSINNNIFELQMNFKNYCKMLEQKNTKTYS